MAVIARPLILVYGDHAESKAKGCIMGCPRFKAHNLTASSWKSSIPQRTFKANKLSYKTKAVALTQTFQMVCSNDD